MIKSILLVKYRLLVLIVKIIVGAIVLLLVYNIWAVPEGKKTFFIPAPTHMSLYKTLADNNYSMYLIDQFILPFVTEPTEGWYEVEESNNSRFSFFSSLHLKKTKTKKLKVYAGETAEELSKRLSQNLNLDEIKLLTAYQKRTRFGEGDIFSSLYTIAPHADEENVMQYLFYYSSTVLDKFEKEYENIRDNKLEHKILLTIASIIQKESNHIEEMPLISSVIYNRLEKDMKLQMDGTLNYGKYSHRIIDSTRIKTDTSDYNTYKNKGLPPTPLCTISIEALEAAYLPDTTDYLFFMLNKDGTHNFTATYKEHLKNIRKFKSKDKKKDKKKKKEKIDTNLSEAIASVE